MFRLAALLLLVGSSLLAQDPVRVACLGDSITFGARLPARARNAYPAQLGYRLGSGYEVRNYGVGGATLISDGDKPYLKTKAFADALAWEPDVAIVMLGTDDTVGPPRNNAAKLDGFSSDAADLVSELRGANPRVRVLLCGPPPMYPDARGLTEKRAADLDERKLRLLGLAYLLRTVAEHQPGVTYHDLTRTLRRGDVVDGVHPNPFGAEAIANRLAHAVRHQDAPAIWRPSSGKFPYWKGFPTARSPAPGLRIVIPTAPARGYPWVWRARFWGHQPDLDLALLDRGFHLVYCDVAGLLGGPEAVKRWDAAYEAVTAAGLSPRPVIEAMSRGGLIAVNWAAANPDRVGGLYLDNAVVDFRSWPGGRNGKRSDADWKDVLAAYGLTEEQAASYDRMPWQRITPLTRRGVPLFLVMGTDDRVVPPAENGERLAARWPKPSLHVWRKTGNGHHPHGLHPPAPLMRAILRATGFDADPTTRAVPATEYRGGAGWGGKPWWGPFDRFRELGKEHPDTDIVFFGDSITQGLTGNTDRFARSGGHRLFDRAFGHRKAVSLGLSGDRTEHLLWRARHGALASMDPKVIVLQIGVNNVGRGHTGAEIGRGVVAVMRELRRREPQADVVICGPFPTGATPEHPRRRAIDEAHALIAKVAAATPRAYYVDLREIFLDDYGRPSTFYMNRDQVHISGPGQDAWLNAIRPLIERLLDGS